MAIRDFHRAPVFGEFFAGAGEYDHRLAHRYNGPGSDDTPRRPTTQRLSRVPC